MDQIASSFKLFSDNSPPSGFAESTPNPWNRVTESLSNLFATRNIPGAIMVFCILLLYLLRERVVELVVENIYEPLVQLLGVAQLQMHLSPKGEYMSTYLPESDVFSGLSEMLSSGEEKTSDVLETIAPF